MFNPCFNNKNAQQAFELIINILMKISFSSDANIYIYIYNIDYYDRAFAKKTEIFRHIPWYLRINIKFETPKICCAMI